MDSLYWGVLQKMERWGQRMQCSGCHLAKSCQNGGNIQATHRALWQEMVTNLAMNKTKQWFPLDKAQMSQFHQKQCNLPPIWDYFHSTKDVDAHRTHLMQEMRRWACQHYGQIIRRLFFDKLTMDEIIKLELCPGTPMTAFQFSSAGPTLVMKQQTFTCENKP